MLPCSTLVVFKLVVVLICVLYVAGAVRLLAGLIMGGGEAIHFVLSVIFLLLAVSVWRLAVWARIVTVIFLWMAIVLSIIGRINPFYASDLMAMGQELPSVQYLVVTTGLFVAGALFCLHMLGKYKGQFKKKFL